MSRFKFFKRYKILDNLGLINLFGKVFGRFFFLLLTSFFAYKLSVQDFANFAIFWATLRLLTFFTSNNLYIVYFNEVRTHLVKHDIWPSTISANIVITTVVLSSISLAVFWLVFNDFLLFLLFYPTLILSVLIRYLCEFAKSDNSLFVSIFIEDFLLNFLFFCLGIVMIHYSNSLYSICYSLLLSVSITALCCVVLFKRKFRLDVKRFKFSFRDFSASNFRLGLNYTIMRGNEVISSFCVRYFGKLYFGDLFVAYAHIIYQFYNVFVLVTMAVVSGMQSKVTVKNPKFFNKQFVKNQYNKMLKTAAPFLLAITLVILVFSSEILQLLFPKYTSYSTLLIKVSCVGLVFMAIQPMVFIFLYNNKTVKIRTLNTFQYIIVLMLYVLPLFFTTINQDYWLLTIMLIFVLIQGGYSLILYQRTP